MNVPKWTEILQYPVIALVCALAVGITVAWWAKLDVSLFFETAEIRRGQVWRLITSVFPHLGVLHLVFNVYWVWILGTIVERVYGHAKTLLLLALFAVGSNSLDFAFAQGGVGLSGVGYGLFGLLWILSARDERFHAAVDRRTVNLFIGWFFFCILTTVAHIYAVANFAHAAGAALGILVGLAITMPARRTLMTASVVAIILFGLWGSTLGRPITNLSGKAGYEEGKWGYDALVAHRDQEAVRWLRDAVKLQPNNPADWFNLGIAYHRLGDMPAARAAYGRARSLDPNKPEYSSAAESEN